MTKPNSSPSIPKDQVLKAFTTIEKYEPKISTVLFPNNKIGKKVIKDLKKWNKITKEIK